MNRYRIVLTLALAIAAAQAQTHKQAKPAASGPAESTPAPPPPGAPWPIETLSVEGNQLYKTGQILAVAKLRAGQVAGKADFEAARDRLVATGAFDNVGYHFAPSPDGKGYDASFEVVEVAQVYPYRFQDLPATDADLRALLKQKDPLFSDKIAATKPVLDRYVGWISEFLAAKNYHEPIIGKPTSDATSDLIVVFRPSKARLNIARVKFTNTGDLPPGLLETAIYGVAVGLPYDEAEFRLLLDTQVRPVFEARGMIRAAFTKIATAPSKDVDGVDVSVEIELGPVYTLDRVSFAGAEAPNQPFAKLANIKTGQTANFDDVKAGQERIAQSLRRAGYLLATSQVERDVNDKDHKVSIAINVISGPEYTLGKLNIVGLDIESEPVIRKMWTINPGMPFNVEYPDHFLDRVKSGGVFDNLKTTRAKTKVDDKAHTVDVTLYFNK
ncbi:MAG TPA: POTRA domain-containing protein [Bryobacteraceae bacterium]|nr:POTRA domain-containing protein [Bryobacteraceae bacterium]